MTRNAKSNYVGRCGTCIYFAFWVKNGDTREHGRCCNPNRVNCHQASQKACKEYKAEEVDGMEDDYEFCEAVNATPTIIEADKEE